MRLAATLLLLVVAQVPRESEIAREIANAFDDLSPGALTSAAITDWPGALFAGEPSVPDWIERTARPPTKG